MPTAIRGGTETYWRTWGEGAPRVLMLHCSLAHSGAWDGLAQRLGCPCLAFDAPGHGRSGPRDPGQDYQDQCLRVAGDFVADGPMDIVGHSFGATVALRLAIERPEAVRRLVLIEPVLFAAAKGTAAYDRHVLAIQPFVAAIRAGDTPLAAQRFTDIWGTGVSWADMRAAQRQALTDQIHVIPAQNDALFEDNAGLLAPGRLDAVQVPVLLLEGAASPDIIAAILDVLQDRLPQTTRRSIRGAGHMLPITHPGAVAAAIGPFLTP